MGTSSTRIWALWSWLTSEWDVKTTIEKQLAFFFSRLARSTWLNFSPLETSSFSKYLTTLAHLSLPDYDESHALLFVQVKMHSSWKSAISKGASKQIVRLAHPRKESYSPLFLHIVGTYSGRSRSNRDFRRAAVEWPALEPNREDEEILRDESSPVFALPAT